MMSPARPPRLATTLLWLLVEAELVDYIEGDLAEEFLERAASSPARARLWYWRQVMSVDLIRLRRESPWHGGPRRVVPRAGLFQDFLSELRLACRSLLNRPGFASVVVGVLALGIAVFAALFGVVDAVFLEPLPYVEPGRLVVVWEDGTRVGASSRWTWSRAFYDAFREETRFHKSLEASFPFPASLLFEDGAQSIPTARVSPGFFDLFGVPARLGRTLQDSDRRAVVLSHALWRRSFDADPDVVGDDVAIEDLNALRDPDSSAPRELYIVIGVMPAKFQMPLSFGRPATLAEMWIPFHPEEAMPNPFTSALNVVGRLREGVGLREARAEAETVHGNIQRRFPDYDRREVAVVPLYEDMVGDVRSTMRLLVAATVFLISSCL